METIYESGTSIKNLNEKKLKEIKGGKGKSW